LEEAPEKLCTEGHYCPQGAISPRQCPIGTFNDKEGQAGQEGCLKCPPGEALSPNCLLSAAAAAPAAAPPAAAAAAAGRAGTYVQRSGVHAQQQQQQQQQLVGVYVHCAGKYCGDAGLGSPSGDCQEGTWCLSGSQIPDASLAYLPSAAVLCPAGYTCPQGAIVPTPCPVGTFKEDKGAPPCQPCPGGAFCAHEALTAAAADGPCFPGYYCKGASTSGAPSDPAQGGLCPEHKYCPAGSSAPLDCPNGTFNNSQGMSSCPPCAAGYVCSNQSVQECPQGGYCPPGQWEETVCAAGTVGLAAGLQQQQQCAECPAGKVCSSGAVSGDCPQGGRVRWACTAQRALQCRCAAAREQQQE
ncbi:hypothetical protein ETH_00036725, partial [Eimeria tenella]